MNEAWITAIAGVITMLGSAVLGHLAGRRAVEAAAIHDKAAAKSEEADAAKSITDSAVVNVQMLRERMAELRTEYDDKIARLERKLKQEGRRAAVADHNNTVLIQYVAKLRAIMEAAHLEVPPLPVLAVFHEDAEA